MLLDTLWTVVLPAYTYTSLQPSRLRPYNPLSDMLTSPGVRSMYMIYIGTNTWFIIGNYYCHINTVATWRHLCVCPSHILCKVTGELRGEIWIHSFNSESPFITMFLVCGRKPVHAGGEHANASSENLSWWLETSTLHVCIAWLWDSVKHQRCSLLICLFMCVLRGDAFSCLDISYSCKWRCSKREKTV